MRELLTELGCEQGSIDCSGVLEIYPSEPEEWCTLGGPSFLLTEKGVEGPFWPDDSLWDLEAPRSCGEVEPVPPGDVAAPNKPEEDKDQAGAA